MNKYYGKYLRDASYYMDEHGMNGSCALLKTVEDRRAIRKIVRALLVLGIIE